jgi:hypothetical protein
VRMDLRWGRGDFNRIRASARELAGLQPDVIVTNGTPATAAVQPMAFASQPPSWRVHSEEQRWVRSRR